MHRTRTKDCHASEWKLDEGTGTITGYASIFDTVDLGGDIVQPGAFSKTLREDRPAKVLWSHDWDEPIGITIGSEEDKKGLRVTGKLFVGENVPTADKAHSLARLGGVDGLSIGYHPVSFEIDRVKNVRHLKEVKLFEWSPVVFPMHPDSRITGVKSVNEQEAESLLEKLESLPDLVGGDTRDLIASGASHLTDLVRRALDADLLTDTVGQEPTAKGKDTALDESVDTLDVAATLEAADSDDILATLRAATTSLQGITG